MIHLNLQKKTNNFKLTNEFCISFDVISLRNNIPLELATKSVSNKEGIAQYLNNNSYIF